SSPPEVQTGIPWTQLGVLGLSVAAISMADLFRSALLAVSLVAIGLALIGLIVRMGPHARVRLLPLRTGDLRTICGAGYASMFALTAGSMALTVYGPAILQPLAGLSP